jgi:hypothetical protein
MSDKQYKTEWSFDFDKAGEKIRQAVSDFVGEPETKTEQFNVPLEGTSAAHVQLSLSVGQTEIKPLADESPNLFEADVTYVGELEFEVSGDVTKTVKLGQKASLGGVGDSIKHSIGWIAKRGKDLKWNIGLTTEIPLDLTLNGGVGTANLDLSGIHLRGLRLESGVGEISVRLPATPDRYDVTIDGGVGRVQLHIASDALVNVRVNGGVGATYVTIEKDAHVNMDIDAGVGETRIEVPAEADVHVSADGGLGNVSVPQRLTRISGGDSFMGNSGTWETPGYNSAENKITIDYDGGLGQLVIR